MSDAKLFTTRADSLSRPGLGGASIYATQALLLNKAGLPTEASIYATYGFVLRKLSPTVTMRDQTTPVRRLRPEGWVALFHPLVADGSAQVPIIPAP